MESQACYQVFLRKERRWKGKGESLSFSPYGEKKKIRKNLFSVIIYDQQYHQLNNTLVWQAFLN